MSKKPQGQYEIDWSNPLAKKLAVCVVAGQPKELVHGFNLKYRNGATLSTNALGQVLDTNASLAVVELEGSESLDLKAGEDFSAYSHQKFGIDKAGTIVSKRSNAGCNWQMYTGTSGDLSFRVNAKYVNDSYGVSTDEYIGQGVTWDESTYKQYVNGSLYSTDALVATVANANVAITIGARWSTTLPAVTYDGDVELAVAFVWYDRLLTAEDMQSLHDNPYQILKPVRTIQNDATYAALFGTGAGQTATLGLVVETNTAQTLQAVGQTVVLSLVAEANTSLPLSGLKELSLPLTLETDLALGVSVDRAKQIALVSEVDNALPVTSSKVVQLGLVLESDTSLTLSTVVGTPIGLVTETDSAFGISTVKVKQLGLAVETDTTLVITTSKTVQLGLATEIDLALLISAKVGSSLALAVETDVAQPVTKSKVKEIGIALESDNALSLNIAKSYVLGLATEVDTALSIDASQNTLIALVEETDIALSLSTGKQVSLGLATEIDTSLPITITPQQIVVIGQVVETNLAFSITLVKAVSLGIATEYDSSLQLKNVLDIFKNSVRSNSSITRALRNNSNIQKSIRKEVAI